MTLGLTSLASVAHTAKQKTLHGPGVISNGSYFDLLLFLGALENSGALLAKVKD